MKLIITEGFTEELTPDLKYYAFDWDDNLMYMPTKIMLMDSEGNEVGMGTEDFAEHRVDVGKKDFEYVSYIPYRFCFCKSRQLCRECFN